MRAYPLCAQAFCARVCIMRAGILREGFYDSGIWGFTRLFFLFTIPLLIFLKEGIVNKSNFFFYASLASVVLSIMAYQEDPQKGIFIGLWAPTLMTLANRYK